MGMAASQLNFLALTARKSDIGFELQRLSNSKEALTRDMQKVTREYRDALSTKTLKWSGNSGVTYTDLSYSTLMYQGSTRDNTPLLITNSNGNVVVDEKYAEYAKMLSDNGGKYEKETRYNILSGLTGIPVDTLKLYDSTSAAASAQSDAVTTAYNNREAVANRNYNKDQLLSKLLGSSVLSYTKSNLVGKDIDASTFGNTIKNALIGKNYFSSTDEAKIKNIVDQNVDIINKDKNSEDYKFMTAEEFVSGIIDALLYTLGSNSALKVMVDEKNNMAGTQPEYEAADAAYKAAQAAYQSAVGTNGEVLTSPQQKQIEFYDRLFQAIADMGWEADEGVKNTEYLNQMLQNNTYYITTMTENKCYNEKEPISSRNYKFYYDTELAENDPNIFKVNDSDVHEEALVKYEYDKSLINEKEKRIDTRMKNLETEQSAISKMLESIDKVKNDNIERTFALWT